MKKKLLIVSGGMELGGIERSLLGLLNELDYEKYDVDLKLFSVKGELLACVDKRVNILPQDDRAASMILSIKETAKKYPVMALKRLLTRLYVSLRYGSGDSAAFAVLSGYHRHCVGQMKPVKGHYDIAVSYMWPHDYVVKKTDADVKYAFIHTDYGVAAMNFKKDGKIWAQFDKIAAVSDDVGKSFANVYPALKDKIVTFENIMPTALLRAQAQEECPDMKRSGDEKIILSVGRITYPKAFDLAAESAAIMRSRGCNFKWYIIGFGPDEEMLKKKIVELGVEDCFIFLGKRVNPYSYMAACDIYAQPSRYEGKAVTVREAQMLCKPVLITDYATSASQVENGVDGVICPMGPENVAEALIKLINDEDLCKKLSRECSKRDYSNSGSCSVLF